ncbi:MAG: hypothetical protein J6V15_07345, partial [Clostridia bacterium]|nr:hypothetical protein [Clostridia bacterium]
QLTPEMVKLIWGEAVQIYKAGEPLYLTRDLEAAAREIQETYEEENPKVGIIAEYLDRLLPEDWEDRDLYSRRQWLETDGPGTMQREYVCTMEIWAEALNGNPDKFDRYIGKEIGDIMARMPGWQRQGSARRVIKPYGRQRFFERRS